MPCWVRVLPRVTDEASAIEALRSMGYNNPKSMIRKLYGGEYEINGLPVRRELEFKQQYGRSTAVKTARKQFFFVKNETKNADGTIDLFFET